MTLFFDILFNVLPYIAICVCFWFVADRLDDMQHTIDVMKKYINSHDKKFAALNKKAQANKKK